MNKAEMQRLIVSNRGEILELQNKVNRYSTYIRALEADNRSLIEKIEALEERNATLLRENVELLERMREMLKREVDADGRGQVD